MQPRQRSPINRTFRRFRHIFARRFFIWRVQVSDVDIEYQSITFFFQTQVGIRILITIHCENQRNKSS